MSRRAQLRSTIRGTRSSRTSWFFIAVKETQSVLSSRLAFFLCQVSYQAHAHILIKWIIQQKFTMRFTWNWWSVRAACHWRRFMALHDLPKKWKFQMQNFLAYFTVSFSNYVYHYFAFKTIRFCRRVLFLRFFTFTLKLFSKRFYFEK